MGTLLAKIFIKDYQNTDDKTVRKKYGTLTGAVGIIVNFMLAIVKFALGFITASVSIMADAFNNLSDAGSSVITIVSFKIASKPADREHPFGHARFEYIASMVISFLILLVGCQMISDSIKSIFTSSEDKLDLSIITIIFLSISIVAKLLLGFYYRKIGKLINSGTVLAAATDSFTDAISTTGVLVCNIVISLTNWKLVDSIVGIIISVFIIISGLKILNETKNFLIGSAPVDEVTVSIKKIVTEYPDVLSIHDMMVHNYGPGHFIASFHAEVDGSGDIYALHDTIDNIEKRINDELGILCTVHMDPVLLNDPIVNELSALVKNVIHNISDDITIHDFRVVMGTTHTNLIFDIVLPFENQSSPEEIINAVKADVLKINPSYYCVITVDRG